MQGETVVITGATSGLGEAAALEFARRGARIVLVARDGVRADATMAKLKAAGPRVEHKAHLAAFSSIKDMKRVGAEIAAQEPRINVLANNAGALLAKRITTDEGLESTFAVNHMAYFVLTAALLETLRATPGARIINTASSAHSFVRKLDFDDLNSERMGVMYAYGLSKLCNILFTRELAKRLEGSGVTANCFHPGFVASRFGSGNGLLSPLIDFGKNFGAISSEKGADTLIWLATSEQGGKDSGGYYIRRKRAIPSAEAQSDSNAKKLWEISEQLMAQA